MNIPSSARNQIRNLLAVIGSGILFAIGLSLLFVYQYGPSGKFTSRDLLLPPKLLTKLTYEESNSKTGGSSRFVYENIEFSYIDPQSKQQKSITTDPDRYTALYQRIHSDTSIVDIPEKVIASFDPQVASLRIRVRTENHAEWQDEIQIFQEVQFANEKDHYRIQLNDLSSNQWIYFFHPGIYQKAMEMLLP